MIDSLSFDELLAIGLGFQDSGRYSKAVSFFNLAIQADPENASVYENRGWSYYRLSYVDKALMDLDKAIELDPENHIALFNRAKIYIEREQYEEAAMDLRQAVQLFPDSIEYQRNLITVLWNLKRNEELINACNSLEEINADDPYAIFFRGRAKGRLDNYLEGLRDLAKLLNSDPGNADYQNIVGYFLIKIEKEEVALQHLDNALNIHPEHSGALNNRGYIKYLKDDLDGAMEEINHSLANDPSNSDAYKNRALIYLELEEKEKAHRDLLLAKELGFGEDFGEDVEYLLETEFAE